MKRFFQLTLLFTIIAMTVSGCGTLPTPSRMIKAPETVMQPINDSEAEAIVSKLLPKEGKLITPKNLKGVGPIQRIDINKDGKEELLATYRLNGVKLEVVAVLYRETDGKWEEQWKISSPGYEFDWLELTDLTNLKHKELFVGVDSTGGPITIKGAKVFSMETEVPEEIYSTLYKETEVIHNESAGGEAGGDGLVFWIKPGPFGSTVDAYKLELINNEYVLMPDSAGNQYFVKNVLPRYKEKMGTLNEIRDSWAFYYHYANIMLKAGNPELALEAIENGLDKLEGSDTYSRVGSLLVKAKAYDALGNSKGAIEVLEKALEENEHLEERELAPGYETLLYLEMSTAYNALKEADKAMAYKKKAQEAGKRACNIKAYENAVQVPDKPFYKNYLKTESVEKDFKAKFIYAIENR